MRDPGRVLILGAGPTGLGAASRLSELGFDNWRLLERSSEAGGLAASVRDAHGFWWDTGGHVQFSHYRRYDRMIDEVLGDRRVWHRRQSWVWMGDRFVPYPFQYNLHRLDDRDRQAALAGLERATRADLHEDAPGGEESLEAHLLRTFGDGLCELFLLPYNEKVWGYPPSRLGSGWLGERVAPPDLDRVRRNLALARDDVGWGPNQRFFFPLHGGTGVIWRELAARLDPSRVDFGTAVETVDLERRTVSLEGGRELQWDTLVSTLPLDRLCRLARGLAPEVLRAAGSLIYSSCHILGLGLEGSPPPSLRDKAWIYFPDAKSPYYRVTVFSNYSPHNAPKGCWSLMAEVCETPHRPVDARWLPDLAQSALQQDRLIPAPSRLVSRWHRRIEHGYPTPFLGRDQVLPELLTRLEHHRVFSRGRFGAWKYEVSNQDHSFMQGLELVDRLLLDKEELTLHHPEVVNRARPTPQRQS